MEEKKLTGYPSIDNYFGRKITHRLLQTEIDRCARALIACGIKAGDVVSLCLLAIPEAVYLLYAVNKLGAVANFLVLNATPQELHEQIIAAKSKVVITVDLVEEQIAEAVKDSCAEQVISVSLTQSMPTVTAVLFRKKAKPAPTTLTSWNSFMEAGKNVDAGMRYARFIDSQVKALKKKDAIRTKMRIRP